MPEDHFFSFEEMVEDLISFILEKPHFSYELVVGCDSSSGQEPLFTLAVIIRRIGQGGRFYIQKRKLDKPFYSWKERILQEAYFSCELALDLREIIEKEKRGGRLQGVDLSFEHIHADISLGGETRDMVKEVVGFIRGNGFEPKIKPESYGASVVADKYS